jgi:hypothetical protein
MLDCRQIGTLGIAFIEFEAQLQLAVYWQVLWFYAVMMSGCRQIGTLNPNKIHTFK